MHNPQIRKMCMDFQETRALPLRKRALFPCTNAKNALCAWLSCFSALFGCAGGAFGGAVACLCPKCLASVSATRLTLGNCLKQQRKTSVKAGGAAEG